MEDRGHVGRAWWIAGAYFVGAALWVGISSTALEPLRDDPRALLQASGRYGLAFVAATSAALLLVLRRTFAAIDRAEAARRAQERAAEVERRFSATMIESMPGILYLYDQELRFLRWNRSFERVSGYSGEEVARMRPLDFFNPDHHARVAARIGEVFEKGESSVEASFKAKDGAETPYFFTGRRVEFEGQPCLVGIGIDISERVRAEEALAASEHRLRTTLDAVLEGCQLLDRNWTYLYLNEAASRHNRRPNAELLGRRMPDMWPGIDATPVFGLLRRCLEERVPISDEVEFTFPGGVTAWFEVRAQPVPEGMFVLSVEVTERKRAEQALRRLNQTLEAQVAQRTDELRAALVRAESADRLKSAFLAAMSHELRTPLNSIIGFTGILVQGLAGPLTAEQTKQLGMVKASARHLLELINDVLDLSKIEAGQLEVRAEPFPLGASVEKVVEMVRPQATKKGLSLQLHAPALPSMTSDRRRLEQVLLNLLINAVKFTDRGGVTLTVEPLDGRVRFRVTDTGIGISAEDLATLFQPFRQLDQGLTRQHEGTGLGLAICRRLTGLLGGEIVARSEPLRGSEFEVTLPLAR